MVVVMTPEERYYAALGGEIPDHVPIIIWNNKLPGEPIDEQLLDLGVCIVVKSSVWEQVFHNIDIDYKDECAAQETIIRDTVFHTDAGDIQMTQRIMPWTIWIEKYPFSSSDDYGALECLISSRYYEPDFKRFVDDEAKYGHQSVARPVTIHSPMHELIYEFMGIEKFSIEYSENRDRLLHLADVLKQDWRRRIELVAASPAKFAVIEGNTQFSVVGPERFKKYYLPCIQEACDILHSKGIYAGAHLDGDNKTLAPLIAETSLDFIESFTPPPDCDFPLAAARKVWPEKTLIVHVPSSIHLAGIPAIETKLEHILKQVKPGNRFIIGSIEDVPNRGINTLVPLFNYLSTHGKLPLT